MPNNTFDDQSVGLGDRLRSVWSGLISNRRDLFRVGTAAVAAGICNGSPASAGQSATAAAGSENPLARIGIRPYINMTGAFTIHGGLQTVPATKRAMEEASHYSANVDEVMAKVGPRIAELMGAEAALVSAGAAAAAAHAAAGIITGADPEKISQLPNLTGLKSEVIMPRQSRTPYDFAIRSLGLHIINVETREDLFAALSDRTAHLQMLSGERSKIKLEDMVEAGRKIGAPVLVDAAAEWPGVPVPYLKRGADLVCYSGGKILRGPQCTGLLLGRKDLIQAAWICSAPHHGFGRTMKVGKEEMLGMLAAVETLVNQRKYETEVGQWREWLVYIADKLNKVPGIETRVGTTVRPNPHPPLEVKWDPEQIGMTADELHAILLEGEPRIMSLAEGPGHSCTLRSAGMKPGDEKLAAQRLVEVFHEARKKGKKQFRAAASDISGQWDVEIRYPATSSRHVFTINASGHEVSGEHAGQKLKGELGGTIDGDVVILRSGWQIPGFHASLRFDGKVAGNRMSGDVYMGEYGRASWTAVRRA